MTSASPRRRGLVAAVLLLGLLLGYVAGRVERASVTAPDLRTAVLQAFRDRSVADPAVFGRVWDAAQQQHVGAAADDQALYYGAVSGLVGALQDRYSVFFDPVDTAAFKAGLGEATFEGIGAEIGVRDDDLVVIAPLPDSPAATAGLRAGDRILRIDDVVASDLTVDEAVQRIRGQEGTSVRLTVLRDGASEPLVLEVTRARIAVTSVQVSRRDVAGRDVAIVRLTHFSEETGARFAAAARELLLNPPAAVVLDLRNNPGGFLNAATDVAGHFLDDGTIVLTETRVSGDTSTERTSGLPDLTGRPLAVLVNGGSASAAEILAGALQDYDVATVVGEKTFGKGSVQTYEEFADGSSLKLTVATWSTPKGRQINGTGIAPSVEVVDDPVPGGADPVLDRALQLLLATPGAA